MADAEAALREALRKWRRWPKRRIGNVDTTPACLHGVLVQSGLDEIRADLEDIKLELRWIRRIIVGAVVSASLATLLRIGGLLQ